MTEDDPKLPMKSQTFDEPGKPDWKTWAQMVSAPLWQAVALSLDYESDEIRLPSSEIYPST